MILVIILLMTSTLRFPLLLILTLFGTAFAAEPAKLVLALKPDKNPEAMLAERAALATALTPLMGKPVDVIVPLSAAVITEGLANGTIDAAHVASTDLAKMIPDAATAGAATLLLAVEVNGKTTYSSIWLGMKDQAFAGVESLKGQRVAFASKTSTSGGVVPLYDLSKRGLIPAGKGPDAFFGAGNVWYGTGYVSAVERVLAGEAVAAAVSDYVFFGDKHLTAEQKATLKVVATQGPVPTHVIAVSRNLSEANRTTLKEALLGLGTSQAALRDKVFGGPLVTVDEAAHLQPIRAALVVVSAMPL